MHIDGLPKHVFAESLNERVEQFLLHSRNRRIVVTPLTERRMRAFLDGVGLEHAVHAEALTGGAQHREQGHRHRAN